MKAKVICDGTPEGTKILIDEKDIGDIVTRVQIDIGADCQAHVIVHLLPADVEIVGLNPKLVRDE